LGESERNLQSSNIIVRMDGSEVHEWNEATDISLSRSYDKSDKSAALTFAWSCPLGYAIQCPSLEETLQINQLDRILEYQMFFGVPYEFSVGVSSPVSSGGKL